ncbi:MAG: hypothetical protein V9H26_25795 [Verrucomicrobiota bacterium]
MAVVNGVQGSIPNYISGLMKGRMLDFGSPLTIVNQPDRLGAFGGPGGYVTESDGSLSLINFGHHQTDRKFHQPKKNPQLDEKYLSGLQPRVVIPGKNDPLAPRRVNKSAGNRSTLPDLARGGGEDGMPRRCRTLSQMETMAIEIKPVGVGGFIHGRAKILKPHHPQLFLLLQKPADRFRCDAASIDLAQPSLSLASRLAHRKKNDQEIFVETGNSLIHFRYDFWECFQNHQSEKRRATRPEKEPPLDENQPQPELTGHRWVTGIC